MTSLAELAAAAHGYGALERRLFEVLGSWVPATAEPEAKLLLRSQSFQHAWHAELWEELAPPVGTVGEVGEVGDLGDVGEGAGAVGAELTSVVNAIASAPSTVERLRGAYENVLPRLVAAYERLVRAATPARDAPLVRAVGLMVADDRAQIAAGQSLLARLVGTSDGEGPAGTPEAMEVHAEHWRPLRGDEPSGGG